MHSVRFSHGTRPPRVAVPAGACDCHVHVYDARWPRDPSARLNPPDAGVDDYRALQRRIGTGRVVFVTPSTYGTDNRGLLQALAAFGDAARGVAVIRDNEPDEALDALHAAGVRGVRLNLSLGTRHGVADIVPIAQRIAPWGWHLQLLMDADVLAQQAAQLERLPVPLVFDHFARLAPAQAGTHPAHALVRALLRAGRAWVKLSGGYIVSREGHVDDPALDGLARSFLEAAPGRVLWGSDWPHATASAGHHAMPDDARQVERLAQWTATPDGLRQVLVENPATLYGFDAPVAAH